MKDTDLQTLAGEINAFVTEKTEPLEKGLSDVVELVDELIQQPAPRDGRDGADGGPGPQGERGLTGEKGEQGERGEAGEQGPAGEKGEQGEQGEVGPQGETGEKGEQGEVGPQGEIGPEGPAGPQGERGPQGEAGEKGETGEPGPAGEQGEPGAKGEAGQDGVGIEVDVWEDRVYREGDLVQYHFGQYFRATKDTAQNPDHQDWERVGNAGFRFAGAYSDEAKFLPGDLYVKDYGCFLQTEDEARLIVGRGPKGLRGQKGRDGVDGKNGIDGKDGAQGDSIVDVAVENDQLIISTRTAKGETKTFGADLGPVMFAAAEITKSYHASEEEKIFDRVEETVKFLVGNYLHHAEDQKAVPVRFYRGLYEVGTSYSAGDMVTFGNEIYIAHKANKGQYPKGSAYQAGIDYWFLIGGTSSIGGSGGGSGGGDGGPVFTNNVFLTNPQRIAKDVGGQFNTQEDANKYFAEELDSLNAAIDTIGEKGYDDTEIKQWVSDLNDKVDDLHAPLTDEEKIRRLKAPLQYRGYLEMDADGKPIAPWDEVLLDENEFGVDRELGGWFGHSTAGFQYGNWDMRDCDWIWLVSDNLAEAYENNDYQAIDTAWKVTPKNVGDTFALEMLQVGLDAWEDDAGFYAFKGTHELEFRVEEIYWPEHPKGWSNTYAPMVRVSQVRDRDYYRYYLREKPEYNFDGDKAISVHLTNLKITNNDLYATKDDLEAIEFPDTDLTPVEERLDAIEDVLPKAPLIIPPVDIGSGKILIDHPTRPSGADKPPEGELWMWHMDADRTGNPANEMKTTVPSEYQANVIIDGINAVWFKQGDRVQKWNTSNGGWWTGGNLWHLSASSTEGDTLIDGQPFEIYYVDPNTTGDDLIDAISRLESKADDRKLQAEIEVLSGQLSTLVKSQEDGEWEFKGELPEVPRQPGQFVLSTSTLNSELNSVHIQETDLGGITHNFAAPVGSYIEIVDIDDPLDYVLFEVTDEPNGTGLISIDVKMVKAGNNFDINDRCIIRFFQIAEGLDINELDTRYLQLTGGTMKGNLAFGGNHWITYINEEGQQYIQFKMGSSTSYTGGYNADDHIATRKRVEEAVAGLASEEWVTEQIEGIPETDLSGLATEEWVNGQIEAIPETDLSGYATEGWVTEQIEAIDIPETDLTGYATEEYVDQKVYQSKFMAGDQVAKIGSSSNNTGAFWIVDGALYCKVS